MNILFLRLLKQFSLPALTLVFYAIIAVNIANASPRVNYSTDIEGTVMAVTPDGYMLISPSAGAEDDNIKVRQWGLTIEPLILELISLGRHIDCEIIYETEDFIGGSCNLLFFDTREQERDVQMLPIDILTRGSSSPYFSTFGLPFTHYLGEIECSDIDYANFPDILTDLPENGGRNIYEVSCEFYENYGK
ncbi:MAG: hypothetical protein L3J37_11595 [Rhodobacteraceae bacterium]|nr:hypothetical protein [Paracoccaceae bacterium]